MVFSSSIFLFIFLPITIIIYYLLRRYTLKNLWLLLVSLFFYSWGEPKYILLMLISITVNYFLAKIIANSINKSKKKIVIILSVIFNLALLFYFKYFNFLIDNINILTGADIKFLDIALPIGISFYTFQIMSYTIDVYNNKVPVQKNILNLGLYISLFPQLIAGPIVRYIDIEQQINNRIEKLDDVYEGFKLFTYGLAKKVLIADTLSNLADIAFSTNNLPTLLAWLGILAYTMQIYYDFSGYSDMALGLGRIFGFKFNQNFNYPYISRSPQEFCRRWHISLSTWFRDYVYIPLGGSKCATYRAYTNRFIVFFLTGFWHGASWNFVIWGLYHGLFLVIDQIMRKISERLKLNHLRFGHFSTMLMVFVGWVFFRAETIQQAMMYLKAMFKFSSNGFWLSMSYLNEELIVCIILAIIFSTPFPNKYFKYIDDKYNIESYIVLILFIITLSYVVGVGFSPFLYFRF